MASTGAGHESAEAVLDALASQVGEQPAIQTLRAALRAYDDGHQSRAGRARRGKRGPLRRTVEAIVRQYNVTDVQGFREWLGGIQDRLHSGQSRTDRVRTNDVAACVAPDEDWWLVFEQGWSVLIGIDSPDGKTETDELLYMLPGDDQARRTKLSNVRRHIRAARTTKPETIPECDGKHRVTHDGRLSG